MDTRFLAALLAPVLLFSGLSDLGLAQDAAPDEDIIGVLDLAASDLDWMGEVETMHVDPETMSYLVRDPVGMMVITAYANAGAAEAAFASGGDAETDFHGARAVDAAQNGTLTWLSNRLVFSVASGTGEAGDWADVLYRSAVDGGLVSGRTTGDIVTEPTDIADQAGVTDAPNMGDGVTGQADRSGSETKPIKPGTAAASSTQVPVSVQQPEPQGQTGPETRTQTGETLLAEAKTLMQSAYPMADPAGRTETFGQAIKLLNQAAAAGSAEALYHIGYLYETGNGVSQDNDIAMSHYEEAARNGYEEAFRSLILVQNQLRQFDAAAITFFRYFKAFPQGALQGIDDYAYSPDVLHAVQRELKRKGYYRGAIDGLIGPATRGAISDYVANEMPDELVLSDAGPSAPVQQDAGPSDPDNDPLQLAFWTSIQDSTDPADFQAYLDQWPNGVFAPLAKNRITRLTGGGGQAPGTAQPVLSTAGSGVSAAIAGDRVNSDESWKVIGSAPVGREWMTPSFDDSGWQAAEAAWPYSPTVPRNIKNMEDTDAQWIWQAGDPDHVWFRKSFGLAARPAFAQLHVTADNNYAVYVNGTLAGADGGDQLTVWNTAEVIDIAPYLQAGTNAIAVVAEDLGGGSGFLADIRLGPSPVSAVGTASGPVTPQPPRVAQPKPQNMGAYYTPQRGTAERTAIMNATRVPISSDLRQPVIFVVNELRSDGHWAYMAATPEQPDGAPIDWSSTDFAEAWREELMTDMVMVLLENRGGQWTVADYVIGPTDVYWYGWVDRYGLPEQFFSPG